MMFFPYGEPEMNYLSQRDPALGAVITRIGKIERPVTRDMFRALIESIISQQISSKAAQTVCARFLSLLGGEIIPERIGAVEDASIQACGMSHRKVSYIRGIAQATQQGRIDFQALAGMQDAQVIDALVALPGVGKWTAQMLLIFSLCRLDVISFDDLGIRRGLMRLYNLPSLSRTQSEEIRNRFSPYASVASLYLWHLDL